MSARPVNFTTTLDCVECGTPLNHDELILGAFCFECRPFNKPPIGEGKIRLSDGAIALIDAQDGDLARFRWYRNHGYVVRSGYGPHRPKLFLHREILGLTDPAVEADHKDRNPLNNRRANLRIATGAQNGQNRPSWGRTSRFRGVCWNRPKGRWEAGAKLSGQKFYLGLFASELDAARAAEAFRRTHMPFAIPDLTLDPIGRCACRPCRESRENPNNPRRDDARRNRRATSRSTRDDERRAEAHQESECLPRSSARGRCEHAQPRTWMLREDGEVSAGHRSRRSRRNRKRLAMNLRRAAVSTNLGRSRLGLSERDVQRGLYPTSARQRLLAVFAAGGAAHIKSGPEPRTPSRVNPQGE